MKVVTRLSLFLCTICTATFAYTSYKDAGSCVEYQGTMFTQAEVQLFKAEEQGLTERWAPYLLGSTINDPDSFAVRIDMDKAKTGEGTLLSKGNQASDKGDRLDIISIVWKTGVSKKKSGLYGSKRYYIKSGEFCHFDLGLDPWKAKMQLIWVTHHG